MRVEVIACDVADSAARAGLFDEIDSRGLTVDILVNNAGIGTIGSVTKTAVDEEIAQVRVNVEAVIDLTTRAVQQMVPRGRGAILNVGSTAGYHPFPGQIGYAATKAFVKSYTEGLRGELAGTGVTVAMLVPGPVRTEFLKSAGMDERTFADAFPKFLWMPSRDVARTGVDALDGDRGTVIAGLPSQLSTRLFQFMPRRLLLPLLKSQHPGLQKGPVSGLRGQRRIQPSTGSASALHSVQIVRYQPTAVSNSIRCSSVEEVAQCFPRRLRPRAGALQFVDRLDQRPLGRAPSAGRPGRR